MKKIFLVVLLSLMIFNVTGCQSNQNKITITFNQTIKNAPKVDSIKVERGSIIEEPIYVDEYQDDETNYLFLGWYNGANKFNFNEPLENDVILYAKWATSKKISAILVNMSADSDAFFYNHIAIIKIEAFQKTIIIKDDSSAIKSLFDTFSKYRISTKYLLYGDRVYDYAVVIGGESSPYIMKYYQWYLLNYELPVEGDYYLIINSFYTDDLQFKGHLIDHSMKKLPTFDPTKRLDEQDEATLNIIQPYIDRVYKDNSK